MQGTKEFLNIENELKTINFEYKEILGSGAFGKVIKALETNKNMECAIKEISKLKIEANILSSMQHPNIIFETKHNFYIVMELAKGGTLKNLMNEKKKNSEQFTDDEASLILKKILKAVEYMHLNNVVHRDLKPENILISKIDELESIKIADFGLSAEFSNVAMSMLLTQKCGTLLYMAPEFINQHQYSKPVDIWSVGIIMYELLTNSHPFFDSEKDSKSRFLKKLKNPHWKFPSKFSLMAKDLFLKMMIISPSERYTAYQALQHPWITRNFSDNIPLTFQENNKLFQSQIFLFHKIKALFFLKFLEMPFKKKINKKYFNFVNNLLLIDLVNLTEENFNSSYDEKEKFNENNENPYIDSVKENKIIIIEPRELKKNNFRIEKLDLNNNKIRIHRPIPNHHDKKDLDKNNSNVFTFTSVSSFQEQNSPLLESSILITHSKKKKDEGYSSPKKSKYNYNLDSPLSKKSLENNISEAKEKSRFEILTNKSVLKMNSNSKSNNPIIVKPFPDEKKTDRSKFFSPQTKSKRIEKNENFKIKIIVPTQNDEEKSSLKNGFEKNKDYFSTNIEKIVKNNRSFNDNIFNKKNDLILVEKKGYHSHKKSADYDNNIYNKSTLRNSVSIKQQKITDRNIENLKMRSKSQHFGNEKNNITFEKYLIDNKIINTQDITKKINNIIKIDKKSSQCIFPPINPAINKNGSLKIIKKT